MTRDEEIEYLNSLKPGELVIETKTNRRGLRGRVYISTNDMTRGSLCVMWEDKMGTSVTHGTRRLADAPDAFVDGVRDQLRRAIVDNSLLNLHGISVDWANAIAERFVLFGADAGLIDQTEWQEWRDALHGRNDLSIGDMIMKYIDHTKLCPMCDDDCKIDGEECPHCCDGVVPISFEPPGSVAK